MALAIDGREREDITWRPFAAFGRDGRAGARSRRPQGADDLVARTDRWGPDLDRLPLDERRIHRLRRLVIDRAGKLIPE